MASGDGFEILAGQGSGTLILVIGGAFEYLPGSEPFGNSASAILKVGGNTVASTEAIGFAGTSADQGIFAVSGGSEDFDDGALTVDANTGIGYSGAILTSSLDSGGTGYAPGDTGTVDGGTGATYEVDTVDGGGEVTAFTITAGGSGYIEATEVSTQVSTGGGDGFFTINVDSITPLSDGAARVTVLYYVMELAA
jgi:hypothetical protein